jgi:hypothetical protein
LFTFGVYKNKESKNDKHNPMATKNTTRTRSLPHGWNARLSELTGFSQPTISRVIKQQDTDHAVWKAFVLLLEEATKEKQAQVEKVNRLREQLTAA